MSIRVTNIQRMCFDDGPGIRTTVFLKGCSLHCPWCSNPENILYEKQEYRQLGKAECRVYGNDYESEELLEELSKDRKYWGLDGGVTFSGGEPLLQAEKLETVWRKLKEEKIHLAMETALFVPENQIEIAEKYIDFFYVDVKILGKKMCKNILGGNVTQYLKNVKRLTELNKNICFRVPCSKEYVLNAENRKYLLDFFKNYQSFSVEIFGIHDLGKSKYEMLGSKMPKFQEVTQDDLEQLKLELIQIGCNVKIISI